jgi:hypothetical protein
MTNRGGLLAWGAVLLLLFELVAAAGLAVVGSLRHRDRMDDREANGRLVSELGLDSLALWSDASYCRHPSTSGFFDAHADHPSALEHFPAGSIVAPPPGGQLDDGGGSPRSHP